MVNPSLPEHKRVLNCADGALATNFPGHVERSVAIVFG
jgi:hypothetical protein